MAGKQFNGFGSTKASNNAGQARKETKPVKDYILLPLWITDPPFSQGPKSSQDDGFKPLSDDEKKVDEGEDEDVGADADMNNLDTTIPVSPIPTIRIHKDHPLNQVLEFAFNNTTRTCAKESGGKNGRDLQLEDAKGVDCLPNATIFEQLTLMGYEKLSQKLTFYKAFFSPQWKFLIHTILQCLSSKTTAWNEFSSTMASAIIYLATNQKCACQKDMDDSLVRATTTASSLEAEQDSGIGPRRQETIGDTIAQTGIEFLLSRDDLVKRLFAAATITTEEITLAQALVEIKTSKPKVRVIVFQEPSESTTTTISLKKSQDKGKAIMVEEPVKSTKRKEQIRLDEEVAQRLQAKLLAELEEKERLVREKEEESNITLIESWDNVQATIDADYQLAEQLQAQEQEELTIEEKSKLFQQLLETRRKHFEAKRAEEKEK
ncbi:hypothetical protein Tco_0121212 [Tanacetum coccineum]